MTPPSIPPATNPSSEPDPLPAKGSWPWRYVTLLLVLLGAGFAICVAWAPSRISLVTLLLLLGLACMAELARRAEMGRDTAGGFSAVILAAAVPLVGPVGAAIVGTVPQLLTQVRGTPLIGRLFNTAQAGLIGLLGGVVYLIAGGNTDFGAASSGTTLLTGVLAPVLLASVVMMLLNAALIAGILRLAAGSTLRGGFVQTLSSAWLTYIGYGLVGFLFVVLWQVERLGPLSVVLVLAPLMLAYWSISGAVAEREAQLRTVRTLVAAVETRGAQRRGQSERVSQVCDVIGEEFHLPPKRAEALQYAAALHNIGLVAPPEHTAPGELTAERAEHIVQHPARGVEMLRNIDFLGESASAIASHHERWDGAGYPHGLRGEQIPLLARIVAVADVYVALSWGPDALTPTEAMGRIEGRSGSHLDPDCVAALRRAWQRGRLPDQRTSPREFLDLDHDLPELADRLVRFTQLGRLGDVRSR